MADELQLSARLKFAKGARNADTDGMGITGLTFDVSGTDFIHASQSIATSATAIDIGGITACGYMVVVNRDSTNYVEISRATLSSGQGTIKLLAGEFAVFRLGSNTPYAIADTAAVEIEYIIVEA